MGPNTTQVQPYSLSIITIEELMSAPQHSEFSHNFPLLQLHPSFQEPLKKGLQNCLRKREIEN